MSPPKWTPDAVAQILIDPRYCLSNPPVISDEQWIEANAKAIDQMGAHSWLATFLSFMRDNKW